jgi:uncharacterized protein (DUF433 family)
MNWRDHIDSDPEIIGGKPKIKGTRIGVGLILQRLSDGWSGEQLIEAYPNITADQIAACQSMAAELLSAATTETIFDRPDPIIAEIHESRREIAARCNGDGRRISADARKRQRSEGRPIWRPEAGERAPEPLTDAANQDG